MKVGRGIGCVAICVLAGTVAALLRCSSPVAGGGSEIGNPVVCGVIINKDGMPAQDFEVGLYPHDYNAALDARGYQVTRTGTDGRYVFEDVDGGTYTLYGHRAGTQVSAYRDGIVTGNERYEVDTCTLLHDGVVLVSIAEPDYKTGLSICILGTGLAVPVDSAGDMAIPVPSGTLRVTCSDVSDSAVGYADIDFDNAHVNQSDTLDLRAVQPPAPSVRAARPVWMSDSTITVYVVDTWGGFAPSYQIYWDNWMNSAYQTDTTFTYVYTLESTVERDTFAIRARTRNALDTTLVSGWSEPAEVVIVREPMVTEPNRPEGETLTGMQQSTYATGGAYSSMGDSVEYSLVWTVYQSSPWSRDSTVTVEWAWAGTYGVYARARSTRDTTVVSERSDTLWVTVE